MDRPEIILAPGPTPIPPEVLLAQGSPLVYHRGPGFGSIMREVTERLRQLYRTEAADVLLDDLERDRRARIRGRELLLARAMRCSCRWPASSRSASRRSPRHSGSLCARSTTSGARGSGPDEVAAALAEHPAKAVLLTHSETSTGVIQPIEQLAKVANEAGAMVIVDVVSSLGAVPFEFDAWGIDVAVGGSQKALSASPGIAFVAISERAWQASREATNPRFYFDWRTYKRFADLPDPENPWTPAISVMQGLQAALELYFQDGVDAAMKRHRTLSRAVKEGAKALGLDLFGEGLDDNWTVTRSARPSRADADTISDTIRAEHGCVLAPGQGPLKGKVFRIGHFGYFSELDIIRGLAALEMTLESLGHPVNAGAGGRRGRNGVHGVAHAVRPEEPAR